MTGTYSINITGSRSLRTWGELSYTNVTEKSRVHKIGDLIIAEITGLKIREGNDREIDSVGIGAFDWFDLFKESFPDLDPTEHDEITYKGYKISINQGPTRNITVEHVSPAIIYYSGGSNYGNINYGNANVSSGSFPISGSL